MGDDFFNPWTAGTHVKHEPLWVIAIAFALAVGAGIVAMWATAVILLQLDKLFPFVVRVLS